jgi:hypothetical protein
MFITYNLLVQTPQTLIGQQQLKQFVFTSQIPVWQTLQLISQQLV